MQDEIYQLANAIYHEARGESRVGQAAVGFVVLNRLRSGKWGDTVRAVVWSPRQFSGLVRHEFPGLFLALAQRIMAGLEPNPVGSALFFARSGRGKRIGNHSFW